MKQRRKKTAMNQLREGGGELVDKQMPMFLSLKTPWARV
jgi:hypothetical protein